MAKRRVRRSKPRRYLDRIVIGAGTKVYQVDRLIAVLARLVNS